MKRILPGLLLFMICAAQAQNRDADLLPRAINCLAAKGFLPPSKSAQSTFGYLLDEKSYPGKETLYIVDYANPSSLDGSVFTIFVTKQDRHPDFDIQNNARFVLSSGGTDGVSFVNPPLGGTWTQKHLVSAIQAIEKQPRFTSSINSQPTVDSLDGCRSYSDLPIKRSRK